MRWKMRESRFTGPGDYVINLDDKKLPLKVDKNGFFETSDNPEFPVMVFAKMVEPA